MLAGPPSTLSIPTWNGEQPGLVAARSKAALTSAPHFASSAAASGVAMRNSSSPRIGFLPSAP
jgi:hypothetical protein